MYSPLTGRLRSLLRDLYTALLAIVPDYSHPPSPAHLRPDPFAPLHRFQCPLCLAMPPGLPRPVFSPYECWGCGHSPPLRSSSSLPHISALSVT
jgi:hypothetical protein